MSIQAYVVTQDSSEHELGFFFNDTATTEIYTLSLPAALPISAVEVAVGHDDRGAVRRRALGLVAPLAGDLDRRLHRLRSEEHTSELQSRQYLVCRLLLEKKKSGRRPNRKCTPLNSSHANISYA